MVLVDVVQTQLANQRCMAVLVIFSDIMQTGRWNNFTIIMKVDLRWSEREGFLCAHVCECESSFSSATFEHSHIFGQVSPAAVPSRSTHKIPHDYSPNSPPP
jgi:hypothetical protein